MTIATPQTISSLPKIHARGHLPRPVLTRYLTRKGNKTFRVGLAEMHGYRPSMEDAHEIKVSLPRRSHTGFFGVFDGHGGTEASKFCAQYMSDYIDSLEDINTQSISEAVLKLDDDFITKFQGDDGCTATFSIVQVDGKNIRVTIGNVGDSRSILVKANGEPVFVTKDHKPTDSTELRRIKLAHGSVFRRRVGGNLALSRAIGDKEFKDSDDLPPEKQQVIAVPDVTFHDAEVGDYLIICCDGILEAFNDQELVKFVHEKLQKSNDLAEICADVEMTAVEKSGDNMTIMIVQFADGEDYNKEEECLPGPIWKDDSTFLKAYKNDLEKHGLKMDMISEDMVVKT